MAFMAIKTVVNVDAGGDAQWLSLVVTTYVVRGERGVAACFCCSFRILYLMS